MSVMTPVSWLLVLLMRTMPEHVKKLVGDVGLGMARDREAAMGEGSRIEAVRPPRDCEPNAPEPRVASMGSQGQHCATQRVFSMSSIARPGP